MTCMLSKLTYIPAVVSVWTQKARSKLGSTQTELSANKEGLEAIYWMARCMPSPGSPDYKPDDPEYQALQAQASSTLEAFSQFLSTPAAIELVSEVGIVFWVLRNHGEKAGLLSPPLIREMSGYLDKCKKEINDFEFWIFMRSHEEWIRPLYRNLKPDDSGQVRSLPFLSYESTLTLNFTLIQNPNVAVVASASAKVDDSEDPLVHSAVAAADITTNRASNSIPAVQCASSARPEESGAEVSPLTSLPALSTTRAPESASVEPTPSATRSENAPTPQADPGPTQIDSDVVSKTPASVGSGGTSNTNPQETEAPSGSFPGAPRLTSLPAPSTARAPESAPAEPTLSAPMSEDVPALPEDPGPACADPDEVSATPAQVGSGGTSNTNPQEMELSSTKITSIPQPAVEISGHADPSD